MPYKDKDKQRKYQREWMKKNRAKRREYEKLLKKRAFEILGGNCIYCGCDDIDALELNHIKGGGCKERRIKGRSRKSLFLDIIAGRKGKEEFELTCRICNNWHYLVKIKGLPDRWTIFYHKT